MSWNVQTLYCLLLGLLCTCAAFVDDAICTKKNFKICSASVTFLGLISGLILNKSRLRSHYMTPINCRRKYDHL